jgi:hypothetical protein
MHLTINSKDFQRNFIKPILELDKEGKTTILYQDDYIYAINQFDGITLYNRYTPEEITDGSTFNINLLQLLKGLNCTGAETLSFDIDLKRNELKYKDDLIKFNIRLIENMNIGPVKTNFKKMEDEEYPIEFTITLAALQDIKKANSFTQSLKFYLEMEDGKVFITLGDKLVEHDNQIRIYITDVIKGQLIEMPYKISILDLLCSIKSDIVVKMMANGVIVFEHSGQNYINRYLITPLKK